MPHIDQAYPRLPQLRKLTAGIAVRCLHIARRLAHRWRHMSLVAQFVTAASAVMAAGMLHLGAWVTGQIEAGVVRNSAVSTIFYVDSYIEPLVQGLARGKVIPEPAQAAMRSFLTDTHLGRQIVSIKLYTRSGEPAFSSSRAVVEDRVTLAAGRERAIKSEVFSELSFAVATAEGGQTRRIPVLAIVAPVHKIASNEVIALTEIHLDAAELQEDVKAARLRTILAVGIVTASMLVILYGIVRRGSQTIDEQRVALEQRVDELSRLLAQNESLRRDLVDARARGVATNERVMRRIGADLHDGPAQLIGLTLLRFIDLDPENSGIKPADRKKGFSLLRGVLEDSLTEIRAISYGIAPPELDGVILEKAIELAARIHEKRTGTHVDCRIGNLGPEVPMLIKISLYRFVQEGLNNAFRHAGGLGQQLEAIREGEKLTVRVGDEGKGFQPDLKCASGGLGLAGLRDRVECLGGKFTIDSGVGRGTWLTATFDLNQNG